MNKNILFFVGGMKKGGAERVISIMLAHFVNHPKLNIHLILMEEGLEYTLPPNISPIVLHNGKKGNIRKFIELPFIAVKIARFAKKNQIDSIISFLYRPNYINIMTKLFGYKGKNIINIRSTTSRYQNEGLKGKMNLVLVKYLFNKADLIISNSKGVEEDLNQLMHITTKHISIPNPIDMKNVKVLENSNQGITKFIDENINYIISVGRLIPLKRNKDLLLAFSRIHEQLDNTKLLFLGDGYLKSTLIKYSNELGIEEKVIFLGNVDNPFYYLKRSKLFVLTSEIEGFPNALLEAMGCGVPVISSNCKSGPSELLENGKYGFLYKVGDTNTLAEHILLIMNNKDIQLKYSQFSLQRSLEYDINKIMYKFEEQLL